MTWKRTTIKNVWLAGWLLAGLVPGLHAGSWKLAWADEFEVDGMPDAAKWGSEEGFIRNTEMQYYTRSRKENARVENGMLVIEGRKERFKNRHHVPDSDNWKTQFAYADYTSASLTTRKTRSFRYGRVEVRAKIPHGIGVWPAIWTCGTGEGNSGWPQCGEIDIMEFVGKEPDRIHATVHYAADGKHRKSHRSLEVEKPYADFHVYAIEWFEDRIDFYFDKTRYCTFAVDEAGAGADNPFRKPHFLRLNLALGGQWGGPVIDDAMLPQQYLVDYVRVYEWDGNPSP